jgi:predicted chitinase
MTVLDIQRFFAMIRTAPFSGRLTAAQVRGTELIVDVFADRAPDGDARHLAYMLATAFHETAATMQPVRETLAASDDAAIRILDRAYAAGQLGQVRTPYWRRDADGKSWLGRGLVQLTHRRNYEAMSAVTGIDLVERPERAMEPQVSATILVEGMLRGSFTGRRLSQYFDARRADWEGARAIVNGTDRAALIAGYGQTFHAALTATLIEQPAVG